MSPADLAVAGSRADLVRRVTRVIRHAANTEPCRREEKITEAAHGIADIILNHKVAT